MSEEEIHIYRMKSRKSLSFTYNFRTMSRMLGMDCRLWGHSQLSLFRALEAEEGPFLNIIR